MKRSILVYATAMLLVYSCIPPGGGLDDDPGTPTPIPKEASIEGLGTLPIREEGIYYSTTPNAMSADGSIVVGSGVTSEYTTEAFRWENGVMTVLEGPPPADSDFLRGTIKAKDVSLDGSIVVGTSLLYNKEEIVAWRNGKRETIYESEDDLLNSTAISDDGAVILIEFFFEESLIWKKDTIINSGLYSPTDVNSDGSVIVGSSSDKKAVRWVDGKVEKLGVPPEVNTTQPTAVNPDGSVVLMNAYNGDGIVKAFRWKNGKVQPLDSLPPGDSTYALGVSADGSVIVGKKHGPNGSGAFIWTEEGGLRDLKEFLKEEYDLDLEGHWRLSEATNISYDGTVICGFGEDLEKKDDPYYKGEPWRVVLINE